LSKTGSYIGGHSIWDRKDLLTDKDRVQAARKAACKTAQKAARDADKVAREVRKREAERASDRLAAQAARAMIRAEAEKAAAGPRLEIRHVSGPDGRKVAVRVWR